METLTITDSAGGTLELSEHEHSLVVGTTEASLHDQPLVVIDDHNAEAIRKWLDNYLMDKEMRECL